MRFLNSSTARFALLIGFIPLALTSPARAAILNGGFEDDFTDWMTTGDASIQTGAFGSGPTQGNAQALLTTASAWFADDFPDESGTFNFSGNEPAIVGSPGGLEDFLGVSLGSLPGSDSFFDFPFEGSALKQTFNVQVGDILSFDWNFLTNDSFYSDYGFVMLDGISQLAEATDILSPSSTVFSQETGFQTFSYTFTTSGEYTLALGVIDVGDFDNSSALLVDNINLTSDTPVPEPSSVLGVFLFGGLASTVLKKRQRQT